MKSKIDQRSRRLFSIGGAGQGDAALALQRLYRARLLGVGVLDRLRLVQHHEPPGRLGESVDPQQRAVARHDKIGGRKALRSSRFQFGGGSEGGMRHHDPQARGEARRFRRPVGEQRRRGDEEARSAGRLPPLQRQQQREHLDRLAEPHVVGEAGAEPKPGQEVEPTHSGALVGPQLRFQRRAQVGLGQRLRISAPFQRLDEPGPSLDPRPFDVGRRAARAAQIGAGEKPHRLCEGKALLPRKALHRLELVERRLQTLAVDLDPFSPQQREALGRPQQIFDFLCGEGLAVEAHAQVEIEQRGDAGHRRGCGADRRLDARTARTIHAPARRHPHDQPGLLHRLDVFEEAHGVLGRPTQGMEDFAGVDDLLQPVEAIRRAADRLEQAEQFRLVAGVVAQRLAKRRMAQGAVFGERGDIGRHEGEREIRVAPIFGEIEVHAADQPPAAVAALEKLLQRPAAGGKLCLKRFLQGPPELKQDFGAQIFAARHRWRGVDQGRQLFQWRRRNRYRLGAGAERRDEAHGEAAPKGQRRRQESSSLAQPQLQKAVSRPPGETLFKAVRNHFVEGSLRLGRLQAQDAVRRQHRCQRSRHQKRGVFADFIPLPNTQRESASTSKRAKSPIVRKKPGRYRP